MATAQNAWSASAATRSAPWSLPRKTSIGIATIDANGSAYTTSRTPSGPIAIGTRNPGEQHGHQQRRAGDARWSIHQKVVRLSMKRQPNETAMARTMLGTMASQISGSVGSVIPNASMPTTNGGTERATNWNSARP